MRFFESRACRLAGRSIPSKSSAAVNVMEFERNLKHPWITLKIGQTERCIRQRAKTERFPFPFPRGSICGKRETPPTVTLNAAEGQSQPVGAPIRVGWASPLRVATGGDANWSSAGRRRRSPAHANQRREFVIWRKNESPRVEQFEGANTFPSNSLKGIATFSLDFQVQAHKRCLGAGTKTKQPSEYVYWHSAFAAAPYQLFLVFSPPRAQSMDLRACNSRQLRRRWMLLASVSAIFERTVTCHF